MVQRFKHRPAARVAGKVPAPVQRVEFGRLVAVGRWLAQRWPFGSIEASRLAQARTAFIETLAGIPAASCTNLPQRIVQAASIEELWHLRSALYSVVARQFDQAEAEQRLRELNRHFAPGATRSGFGALGGRQSSGPAIRVSRDSKAGTRRR